MKLSANGTSQSAIPSNLSAIGISFSDIVHSISDSK